MYIYLTVTLAMAAVCVVLFCLVKSCLSHPTKLSDPEFMRFLRKQAFIMLPAISRLTSTVELPKVYGVIFEFPLEGFIDTVVAFSDGNASLYSTGTFGVIGGCTHETVRAAAKEFVKAAQDFYDEAETTTEFPYPNPGRSRFYFHTYTGVRFIDTDFESLASGTNQYATLFIKGHLLLAEIRRMLQVQGTETTNDPDHD